MMTINETVSRFREMEKEQWIDYIVTMYPSKRASVLRSVGSKELLDLYNQSEEVRDTLDGAKELSNEILMALKTMIKVEALVSDNGVLNKARIFEELKSIDIAPADADEYLEKIDEAVKERWQLKNGVWDQVLEGHASFQIPEKKDPLSGLPADFASLLKGIKVKSITDDDPETLLMNNDHAYKISRVIIDAKDYAVLGAMPAGMILPSEKERSRRWIICCHKEGTKWEQIQKTMYTDLIFSDGRMPAFRSTDITEIQVNRDKRLFPKWVKIKIARINSLALAVPSEI